MAYSLEVSEKLDKVFNKLAKKDKVAFNAISRKVNQILQNPHHCKPLKAPMQNMRRVHFSSSFVLIFKVDEERKVVQLLEFEHHRWSL